MVLGVASAVTEESKQELRHSGRTVPDDVGIAVHVLANRCTGGGLACGVKVVLVHHGGPDPPAVD